MQWLKHGENEYCQECFREYEEQNVPIHLRKPVLTESCRKHRRPDFFQCPESAFYLQLYARLASYNEQREIKKGTTQVSIQLINVPVLQVFCQELEIYFLQTFEILSKIAEQWSEEHHGR